jgi:hypothetical protein
MAMKTWNGSTADWYTNNGGDWTPPGDPGSGDDVVINSGEAELLSGDAPISATIDVGPGNNSLSAADTITAAGLSNTGTINLWGSSTAQATLDISAPAGFGTAGVLSGDVNLNGGKVLLEFKSGPITTIAANSELSIAGTTAFLADASNLTRRLSKAIARP